MVENSLKWLELVKVGLIAHPMQNFYEEHDQHLVLMSGSLMMSKLMILEMPPQSWNRSQVLRDK